MDIVRKIKEAGLKGKGGGGFPTGLKWEIAKKAVGTKKYVICNASEGEPNVFKDGYILENYPEEVINGINIAADFLDAEYSYIYLNKNYYKKIKINLENIIGKNKIIIFEKKAGYIGGEETVVCAAIEGKRIEPRAKPPFLTNCGLFNCPTLMNNVETFYHISKISKGEYKKTRFYSVNGDVINPGVYELPENLTIIQILKETNNYPNFEFFVQAGGGVSGEIMLENELNSLVCGTGSITVFNKKQTDIYILMEKWAEFYHKGNCDKCTPCREGAYRIYEMMKKKEIDIEILEDIFLSLKKTSFCSLGRGMPLPFESLIKKIKNENKT